MADGNNGLVVVDVSDSKNPTKLGAYDTVGSANGVILSSDGTKAYVTSAQDGLIIQDTNFMKVTGVIYSYKYPSSSITLSRDGKKAYIGSFTKGLIIFDVSNPTNPIKLGSYKQCHIDNGTDNIVISKDGKKAYIASDKELLILDVSDPTNPIKIGSYESSAYVGKIALSDDETKAYIGEYYGDSFVILDVSNPTNPTKIGSYNVGFCNDIVISSDETKAYVASYDGGGTNYPQGVFRVLDISDKTNIKQLDSAVTYSTLNGILLSDDETKAYTYEDSSFEVFDINDSTNIKSIAQYKDGSSIPAMKFAKDYNKVYMAKLDEGIVSVLNTSNIVNPIEIYSYSTAGRVTSIALSNDGTTLYTASEFSFEIFSTPDIFQ